MAIIANDTQFIGIAPSIDLTGKKSAILNEQTEPVTMADIIETVGGGSSYLVYTAILNQSGTNAPVATILENTLDATITYARQGDGSYVIISSEGWNVTNTTFTISNSQGLNVILNGLVPSYIPVIGGGKQLNTYGLFGSTPPTVLPIGDNLLKECVLEIRVYP